MIPPVRPGQRRVDRTDPRRPAELARDDDEGFFQQAAGGEVVEQGGDASVGRREEGILERLEIALVRVPALDVPHVDLDDRHAGLHQPLGQQERLAEHVAAVAVADPRVFLAEREGPRDLARQEERIRLLTLVRERVGRRSAFPGLAMLGDLVEQVAAAVEALDAQADGQGEAFLAEVGAVGVLLDLPGVVLRARNPACCPGQTSGPSIRKVGSRTPLGTPSPRGLA